MAIDPVCGMEVAEQGAEHSLLLDHETVYFCSHQCQQSYLRDHGGKVAKQGFLARFLTKLAKDNNKTYGGKPPCCH